MTTTRWIWLACAALYALFFSWYTSFDGPMTDADVEQHLQAFAANGAAPEQLASLRRFLAADTGDDFVMLNAIELRATPQAVPGVPEGSSSAEVMDRYMAFMWPQLLSRASHPVAIGNAAHRAMDLVAAAGMDTWTQGALMRYRSRRDFMAIVSNPAFSDSHAYKTAALAKTIAYPLDPWFHAGDPRLLLALVLALIACGLSWLTASKR